MQGKLFIVVGPSGVGKTTLVEAALDELRGMSLCKVVTYTTRLQREHEVNGVDYHFISVDDFCAKKAQEFFLESNFWCGNYYGSSKESVAGMQQGISYIMILDCTGPVQ